MTAVKFLELGSHLGSDGQVIPELQLSYLIFQARRKRTQFCSLSIIRQESRFHHV